MSGAAARRLLVDTGGTNTRVAVYQPSSDEVLALRCYANDDFAGLEAILHDYLNALPEAPPAEACIAIAALLESDSLRMFNRDWRVSRSGLEREFGWQHCIWLNDFAANAHALPFLCEDDLHCINAPTEARKRPQNERFAVLGPGTGLGGAVLVLDGEGNRVLSAEPGHMGLSPGNAEELALFERLLSQYPQIYAELLVSGPGLQKLYQSLGALRGQRVESLDAAAISERGIRADSGLCHDALTMFCALLGSVAGDFLLATGAFDRLYLAGGILPRMQDFLYNSPFLERLIAKGGMRERLEQIPVYLIRAPQPGLIGAAHAPSPSPSPYPSS